MHFYQVICFYVLTKARDRGIQTNFSHIVSYSDPLGYTNMSHDCHIRSVLQTMLVCDVLFFQLMMQAENIRRFRSQVMHSKLVDSRLQYHDTLG